MAQRKRDNRRKQLPRDSDDRYRAYVNNTNEGIWCVEFDRNLYIDAPEDEQFDHIYKYAYIAEANDAYARSVGYQHGEDLVGKRVEEFLPQSEPTNIAFIKAHIRGRYSVTNAETVESFKGGIKRVFLNNSTGIIEDGCVVRVWGAQTDITDQKVLEEKLRKAEQMYRTVADFTYDWEYWEAPDGTLTYVSPSCERITGYGISEFMARSELISEIILPEDRNIWENHRHGVKAGSETATGHIHFRVKNKDGHTRWIAHVCQPVFNDQGEYAGVRVSNRDITNLRIAEQEAREYREILAQLDRTAMLGQLTGSIAHELYQPLTGILSSAQAGELLLEQGNADAIEIGEILTDVIADAKRSAEIIRNLRNLFGLQKTEFEVLSLNAQIEEVLRILNSEFVIHNVAVHTDFCSALPTVRANGIQLQQVVINLISNAIQAMQQSAKGIRSISITTAKGNGREIKVQVEDSGPGIDPEQLNGIFEPLTTSKPGGLGMGLSISRSIVQAHDGRIWAENVPAGGARINFTLPVSEKKS